jgi:hypothetical protein
VGKNNNRGADVPGVPNLLKRVVKARVARIEAGEDMLHEGGFDTTGHCHAALMAATEKEVEKARKEMEALAKQHRNDRLKKWAAWVDEARTLRKRWRATKKK